MNRISGSISSLNESFDMKKCHCLQQDLNPGPCGCKSNVIPTQLQQLDTPCHMQKWFIYESLPQISFLVMKVVSCGLAQRILVIHGGLTREYPKYPLTQSVGRENLSGESLVSCAPSRFSLEILPPSLLRSGIFTDTHSFAPEYYYIAVPCPLFLSFVVW